LQLNAIVTQRASGDVPNGTPSSHFVDQSAEPCLARCRGIEAEKLVSRGECRCPRQQEMLNIIDIQLLSHGRLLHLIEHGREGLLEA
jgi:hypothetical protein